MKKLYSTFILVLTLIAASMSVSAQRNCGTMDNLERLQVEFPQSVKQMEGIERHTNNFVFQQADAKAGGIVTIPVVVHVVYGSSSQNISTAQIQSQIDVLNEDFRRLNADKTNTPSRFESVASDVEVEFCLASIDPNGNATSGITRTSTSTSSFSTNDGVKYNSSGGKNAWPTDQYLNLWVCNLSGTLLGYAQFPGSGSASTDGVVISYKYFGRGGSAQAPFNKGRTATHEVGHWLNLRHIWGDQYCGNDYVSDTPTQQTSSSGCPSNQYTCSSYDMTSNYMDYSDDGCMNLFSAGQKSRMRALFSSGGFRESLMSSPGCGGSSGFCASNGQDASYEWIANVTLGSINNNTGNDGGYGDHTSVSTNLVTGSNNSISLSPGFASSAYDEYWKVWIDYNQDGDFNDAGELAFDAGSLSSSTVSGTISVPSSATTGSTRMRVTMKYNGEPSACESFEYGEVEDYTVNITAPVCNIPGGISAANITETSALVSWGSTGAGSYTVRYRKSGTSTWSTVSSTSTSKSIGGLTGATSYDYGVRSNCSGTSSSYSSSKSFTTLTPSTGYCASKGSNSSYEWIASVNVGTISNSTGNNNGYADFTSLSTDLQQGTSYGVSLSPGFASSSYDEYWKIWIDYNQDGDFNDAGELVFDAGSLSSATVNGNITISGSALLGSTRMRVSMKYNGAQTSCETFEYGEVEDYSVNIISSAVSYCSSKGNDAS